MTDSAAAAPGYRIEVGYEFRPETLSVSRSEQQRLHDLCGIPRELYGDCVDPTFLARRPILLNTDSINACYPEHGKVHIVHRLRQFAPTRLDQPVAMTGRFTAVDDVPRGRSATSIWDYHADDGMLVLQVEPDVLMIDPERAPKGDDRGRPDKAAPPPNDGFELLAHKQLTPEATCEYCAGTTNLIHIDPEHARGFGFRAPIIAGNHTVNFLLQGAFNDGFPNRFAVEIRFLRPVFWDDAVDILGRRDGDGRIVEVRALNAGAKILADCRLLPD